MYIDKDYSIIYNDIYNYSVHPAICEGWHVTHMLKTLAWPHLFTRWGGVGLYILFSTATIFWSACTMPGKWIVMYLCARDIEFASVYEVDI